MNLSNPSQLLLRNIDSLASKTPLIINCPDALLFDILQQHYPQCAPTSLHFNFADYNSVKLHCGDRVTSHFCANYSANIKHDLVIIYFPKSKDELTYTLSMISPMLSEDATLLFVGDNKGGVKSCQKLVVPYTTWCRKEDSARHCSLYIGLFNNNVSPFSMDDWFKETQIALNDISFTIFSLPGVFSSDKLDKGTLVLLKNMPTSLQGDVLDFGCGSGVIGTFAYLNNSAINTVDFVDVNALALASCNKTLRVNNIPGQTIASDSLHQVTLKYNTVLSNPPFHQGIKTNYQATEYFLNHIKKHLHPKASVYIIANSFLAYKPILESQLPYYQTVVVENGFSLHLAQAR